MKITRYFSLIDNSVIALGGNLFKKSFDSLLLITDAKRMNFLRFGIIILCECNKNLF